LSSVNVYSISLSENAAEVVKPKGRAGSRKAPAKKVPPQTPPPPPPQKKKRANIIELCETYDLLFLFTNRKKPLQFRMRMMK